ncbi:MAG: hypothetical protein CMN78_01665 [Spirochaetales bacterium]|nr:hypothetical protein [Spirochaetales bacterium]
MPEDKKGGHLSQKSPFVGRSIELNRLKQAVHEAREGQGNLIVISGESGIGKSRLAREFSSYSESTGIEVLWGRSYSGRGAPPFWPWVQITGGYLHSHSPEEVLTHIGPRASVIAEMVPHIKEHFPDLPQPIRLDDPEHARFRFLDSYTTFLKDAAASSPLMIILDDLHTADEPTLRLMEFIAYELKHSHLLIVAMFCDTEVAKKKKPH